MNSTYATAFKLHTLGFSVIPSGGGDKGKAPLVNWRDFQDKPPDDGQLQNWQDTLQPHLWGIVTGAISGLVVVDADTSEARADLEKLLGPPHILTPRGGGHWYFKQPEGAVKIKVGILRPVDIRADGGFVNVVGKRLDGAYKILTLPHSETLIPWERLPVRIKAALDGNNREHPHSQPITTKIFEGEGRNHAVDREAGRLCHIYKDPAIVKPMVWAYNQAVCVPPLSDEENARTWEKSLEKWASKENAPESPPLLARTPSCRGFPRSSG